MKLLRFLPLLLLLCGCAREVSPVSALALDCKNGVYCLTAEVVRQDSPDDTAAPAYLSATGTDVTDALRNLRSILPGDLYLSHAQVLLLSEDAVSESILPLADYLCRENDVRLSLRAAVVRDGSAAELLENDNEVYALSELLDRSAQTVFCRICRCTASPMCCTQTAQPFFRPCAWMRLDRRHRQARQCSKTNG